MASDRASREVPAEEAEPNPALTLLSRFLRAVSEKDYEEAEALSETILKLEPDNKIILEYQPLLRRAQPVSSRAS